MEPGRQRVAAALLIKATLRQAQAQWRVQPPLWFTVDGVTGAGPVLRLDEGKTTVQVGFADREGLTPQRVRQLPPQGAKQISRFPTQQALGGRSDVQQKRQFLPRIIDGAVQVSQSGQQPIESGEIGMVRCLSVQPVQLPLGFAQVPG